MRHDKPAPGWKVVEEPFGKALFGAAYQAIGPDGRNSCMLCGYPSIAQYQRACEYSWKEYRKAQEVIKGAAPQGQQN